MKMKVLWLSVTPSLYTDHIIGHNGGGWIAALEKSVRTVDGVELGIAFEYPGGGDVITRGQVTYFPIDVALGVWERMRLKFTHKQKDEKVIASLIRCVEQFRPDVIHVFGAEWCYGMITPFVNVPVIVHVQGSLPSYVNAHFPPGFGVWEEMLSNLMNPKKVVSAFLSEKLRRELAVREMNIYKMCSYFMGRTKWDRSLVALYSNCGQYYRCEEMLRTEIWKYKGCWKIRNEPVKKIVSVASPGMIKGHDVVLKTAKLLKEFYQGKFEWFIFGTDGLERAKSITGISPNDVNVSAMGVVDAAHLSDALINSDIFVHLSYADNSPNSVCEAQLIGLPIVATYVGGVPSLIEHEKNGMLVPANDPMVTCQSIVDILDDAVLSGKLSMNAVEMAAKRHEPEVIVDTLLSLYRDVCEDYKMKADK